MIRIRFSDFKAWYGDNNLHNLYHALLPVAKGEPNEVIAIDETAIKGEAFRLQFADWVRNNPSKVLGPEQLAPAPTPISTSVEPDDELARMQKARREQAQANEEAINAAANARVGQWIKEGMVESVNNSNALLNWFKTNNAEYTAYNVDVAVQSLSAQGQIEWTIWSKNHPANRAPVEEESQPQPEEVLERLRNGERQLPLNSSEADLRKASKEQVADWLERKRKAENKQYVLSTNSHGTSVPGWESTMN